MSEEKDLLRSEFILQVKSNMGESGFGYSQQFFEEVAIYMEEVGEIEDPVFDYFSPAGQKLEVHGYSLNRSSEELNPTLNLFLVETSGVETISTLTKREMESAYKRLRSFTEACDDGTFVRSLEITRGIYELADLINRREQNPIEKIKLTIITDKKLSNRIDGIPGGEVLGIPVVYSVWDIDRIIEVAQSGSGRDPITIHFDGEFGDPIPCLRAANEGAEYDAYLLVFPAVVLAKIYDRWDSRLLEANVRVFLQAKGSVNRGIKDTLERAPEKFLAYNNGLTATASSVTVFTTNKGLLISKIHDLQIVNGGQTTASIHSAFRRGVPLSKVFVQMKLSVVENLNETDLVQRISRYANSQNKVSEADFFSHHPYHVRLEKFSREHFAPTRDGSVRQSKWFYERARGQYLDQLVRAKSQSKIRNQYPKNQVINKTDHAKFEMTFNRAPHIVSMGAQKAFLEFAKIINDSWGENGIDVTIPYYEQAIGKAILFKDSGPLVSNASWYESGFRAQVMTYAWAKIAQDMSTRGKVLDYSDVWRRQEIPESAKEAFSMVSPLIYDVIKKADPSERNPAQWAKRLGCWESVKSLKIEYPRAFVSWCLGEVEATSKADNRKSRHAMTNAVMTIKYIEKGKVFWSETLDSININRIAITDVERGIIQNYLAKGKVISEQQAKTLGIMYQRIGNLLAPSLVEFE
jgi:hypothetical protein